jgi:glycine dehydrogenase subunit 1
MRYIPHTADDVARMLGVIGKPSVASLFEHIPARLRIDRPLDIAPLDEGALLSHLGELGAKNQPAVGATARDGAALSFLGAGIIPHTIPSAVDALLKRSEWYTSYTPYQPEISQGTLQAIFEFQTVVSELFGLGVANASMYDGASATAEALLMARRITGRKHAIIANSLHPQYGQTIDTYLAGEEGRTEAAKDRIRLPYGADGRVDLKGLTDLLEKSQDVACVLVQSPNFFGVIEDVRAIAEAAHARDALCVVVTTEPAAFALLESPGALGADIAVGEGIGLATPPSLGGPGVGLFAARAEHVRQLPGRLVGQTADADGRRGFVLTLATREQHIRREKATSNICTNQGLIALAFTIHMCLLGRRGLTFSGPTFNEFAVRLEGRSARAAAESLAQKGLYAGVPATQKGFMTDRSLDDVLLVAVTERHSRADLDRLVAALAEVSA